MNLKSRIAEFGPKDVAKATGLSASMQRDWRRGGYLPARSSGWASFSLEDLAAIALRKALADISFGPSFANRIIDHPEAGRVIDSIVWAVVESSDPSWSINGSDHFVSWVRATNADDHIGVVQLITGIDHKAVGRLLTFFPSSGDLILSDQPLAAHDNAPAPVGVLIFLDQLGASLAQACGRPIVTIEPAIVDPTLSDEGVD